MFKSVTIAALTAAILAGGMSTASALVSLNGGSENGYQQNGGGTNGLGENGGGNNGTGDNGGGSNGRSSKGLKAADAVRSGLVVVGIELPPAQQ
jgi:hypothetical protein